MTAETAAPPWLEMLAYDDEVHEETLRNPRSPPACSVMVVLAELLGEQHRSGRRSALRTAVPHLMQKAPSSLMQAQRACLALLRDLVDANRAEGWVIVSGEISPPNNNLPDGVMGYAWLEFDGWVVDCTRYCQERLGLARYDDTDDYDDDSGPPEYRLYLHRAADFHTGMRVRVRATHDKRDFPDLKQSIPPRLAKASPAKKRPPRPSKKQIKFRRQ